MNQDIYNISMLNLSWALGLVAVVFFIYLKWSLAPMGVVYAAIRMLLQLISIGFVLLYLFEWQSPYVMSAVLLFMLAVAGWISLRPLKKKRGRLYSRAFLSLAAGGLLTLSVVIFFVLELSPWYQPRYLIPLAGMIFANAMTSISLTSDRFFYELEKEAAYEHARNRAFEAGMIPIVNSFFAVGLVSLPGMMTGQILAGVSPLVAVRYQIVVMCMLLCASGLSSSIFLILIKNHSASR